MNGKKGEYGMSWQVSAYSFFLFNSRPRKLVSGRVRRQMDGWMTARKCAIELQVQLQDGAGTTAKATRARRVDITRTSLARQSRPQGSNCDCDCDNLSRLHDARVGGEELTHH